MGKMFVQQFIVVVKGRKKFFINLKINNSVMFPTKSQGNSFHNWHKLHDWFFLDFFVKF